MPPPAPPSPPRPAPAGEAVVHVSVFVVPEATARRLAPSLDDASACLVAPADLSRRRAEWAAGAGALAVELPAARLALGASTRVRGTVGSDPVAVLLRAVTLDEADGAPVVEAHVEVTPRGRTGPLAWGTGGPSFLVVSDRAADGVRVAALIESTWTPAAPAR